MGIGAAANIKLAEAAGLEIGRTKSHRQRRRAIMLL